MSFVSALLRSRASKGLPAVLTAQVSLDGSEVPAWRHLALWANVILRLEHRGRRRVAVGEKPKKILLEFAIKEGGALEWI